MKIIVGLGNPGKTYDKTRHNVGFRALDAYVLKNGLGEWNSKMNGLYVETRIKEEKVIFLKPQRYMNLSGGPLKEYIKFFKATPKDVLIIHDDLDLPCGAIRLRKSGSTGGHNGLKDIENHLGTEEYKRIKIGISNDKALDTKDFVLGKFSKKEEEEISQAIEVVSDIIDDFFNYSFEELQNKYN